MAQRANRAAVIDTDSAAHADLDLGERYVYRDREHVQQYLAAHPRLVPILREADSEIAMRFGKEAVVTLDVIDDPDGFEADTLFGFIQSSLQPKDALEVLHRFDQEWWIGRSTEVKDELGLFIGFG